MADLLQAFLAGMTELWHVAVQLGWMFILALVVSWIVFAFFIVILGTRK